MEIFVAPDSKPLHLTPPEPQVYDFSGKMVKKINVAATRTGVELNLPKKGNYIVKINNEVVIIHFFVKNPVRIAIFEYLGNAEPDCAHRAEGIDCESRWLSGRLEVMEWYISHHA